MIWFKKYRKRAISFVYSYKPIENSNGKHMKNILLLSIFVTAFSFAQIEQIEGKSGAELCSEKRQLGSSSFLKISSPSTLPHTFDVLHYSLDLNLYQNYSGSFPRSFAGNVTITFRADSTINSIQLNGNNTSLGIDSIPSVSSFSHANNVLTVSLGKSYAPGDTLSITIYYHHNNVADGAFYAGTDGMVFTDCEPEGARKWFPCWDKPSDKATVELRATVPKSVKLGSNGRLLLDSLINDSTRVFHWKSRDPIATYLVVLSSKVNYNLDIVYWHTLSNANDSIPIYFYWNPGDDVNGLGNIKSKIIPMIDYYSSLFGEHPFEKNGFATMNSSFTWGGMENQTLTSLMPNGYRSENLVSHEFAHQWFGDMITCDTWGDIWLNEGFATYCEALWRGHMNGYDHYKLDIENDASEYLSANPGIPIYNPSWAAATPSTDILFNGPTTYYKGACVLHMLRSMLGDSLFFHSIHDYATSGTFKFGSASTDDFIQQINESSGEDLTWFFDQWVKKPNHPNYVVEYLLSNDSSATIKISQSNANGMYWKMPIRISFMLDNGPDSVFTIMNSVNNELFHFKFSSIPVSFGFDVQNDIVLKTLTLKKVTSVEMMNGMPLQFSVEQNFPNPFNPSTTIRYSIGTEEFVTIDVFDVLGKHIARLVNQKEPAGVYTVYFTGSAVPSGIYFYRVTAGTASTTKRMVLLK